MPRVIVLLLAVALVGCGVPVQRAPVGAAASTATIPGRQRQAAAGTVVVALPAPVSRLDAPPAALAPTSDVEVADQMVAHLLYSRLVGIDDLGQPFADLAERVPTLENGGARWIGEGDARQVETTFKLRPNAPIKADDVVKAWQKALDARPAEISIERRYERVEARDPSTAVMTLFSERSARAAAARDPNRHGFLRGQRGPVADPLYYAGLPNLWLGPGPFVLRERRSDGSMVLDARPQYHRGAPGVPTLLLRPADPAPALAQLAGGELDVLYLDRPNGALSGALRGMRDVRVAESPGPAVEQIEVNLAKVALRDRGVREALLRGLNRRDLAAAAIGQRAADDQMSGVGPVSARYPSDLIAARQLLRGAGFAIGNDGVAARGVERPMLRLLTTDDARRREVANLVRQQLAQIDLDIVIEPLPAARLFDRQSGPLAIGAYDLALVGAARGADGLGELADRHAGATPALDRLFGRVPASISRDERRQLLSEVEAQLLEELPVLPLFAYPRLIATSPELRGVKLPRTIAPITWNAHEWGL